MCCSCRDFFIFAVCGRCYPGHMNSSSAYFCLLFRRYGTLYIFSICAYNKQIWAEIHEFVEFKEVTTFFFRFAHKQNHWLCWHNIVNEKLNPGVAWRGYTADFMKNKTNIMELSHCHFQQLGTCARIDPLSIVFVYLLHFQFFAVHSVGNKIIIYYWIEAAQKKQREYENAVCINKNENKYVIMIRICMNYIYSRFDRFRACHHIIRGHMHSCTKPITVLNGIFFSAATVAATVDFYFVFSLSFDGFNYSLWFDVYSLELCYHVSHAPTASLFFLRICNCVTLFLCSPQIVPATQKWIVDG